MHRDRKTKIIATLGPASAELVDIRKLFLAGVDLFRLNFSHGSHESHARMFHAIRTLEAEFARPVGIIADLQGPKLRIGTFKDGAIALKAGQSFRIDLDPTPGDTTRVSMPHSEILNILEVGVVVLLDDGKVRLRITAAGPNYVETKVLAGRALSDHKGINVPGVVLPVSAISFKDRDDLNYALELGVDYIALSFVQRPEDVEEARSLIGDRAALIVKLEKPSALDYLDEIVSLTDALMVARGDLGVEMPPEDVPSIQKRLIRTLRQAGKPVIVATQMLESMLISPAPTRAEASDVATAVYDGADAVMLSGETAVGDYPVEAVEIMNRIIQHTEGDHLYRAIMDGDHPIPQKTAADAIIAAARQVANTISATVVVTYTASGSTTLRAARERPETPILSLTSSRPTARKMTLAYGVHAMVVEDMEKFPEAVTHACRIAKDERFAEPGQRIVIVAGVPFGMPGTTNMLRIAWVE
ncbi:MAG: pyruvate kinase [Pseudomonadota bacterium]|nr:pyruvate kinase [Pseudomonadota bacterium]